MPFQKGHSGNPGGLNPQDRDAIFKARKAISRAIDRMKSGQKVGLEALADKICLALEENSVKTLKDLAPLFPKDLYVDTTINTSADKLSDAELAEVVAKRARALRDQDKSPALKETGNG